MKSERLLKMQVNDAIFMRGDFLRNSGAACCVLSEGLLKFLNIKTFGITTKNYFKLTHVRPNTENIYLVYSFSGIELSYLLFKVFNYLLSNFIMIG